MSDLAAPTVDERVPLVSEAVVGRRDWRFRSRQAKGALVVAAVGVVCLNGIVRLVASPPRQPAPVAAAPTPDLDAENYAERVAALSQTYDEKDVAGHLAAVAALVPGADPTLGWDRTGRSVVTGAHTRSDVPVAVGRQVDVVVVANGVPMVVIVTVGKDAAGHPTLIGVPTVGSAPTPGNAVVTAGPAGTEDRQWGDQARPTIEGFLRAWGAGSADISSYIDATFTPPPGPGGFRLVSTTYHAPPGGDVRAVPVAVRWALPDGRTIGSTYSVAVAHQGNAWKITDLDISTSLNFTDLP